MKSPFSLLSALSLALGQAAAYLITPDGTPSPDSTEDCSYWVAYINMPPVSCERVYGITAAELGKTNTG
ncbi:uncharacterized protein N7518_006442 [Penicillium psychrosexuale]|uniref:uncharacterized protein n=1 Tax=Penicillium psychrosexuale TaxID=1002107 RepID=UPI002545A932|nr:uncharacterized protein N7518_006442 [Penicillium psychrosexuale]KAJ5789431.1 hypothetical protein N7518_006442 [Penicillium psychrosexuale]